MWAKGATLMIFVEQTKRCLWAVMGDIGWCMLKHEWIIYFMNYMCNAFNTIELFEYIISESRPRNHQSCLLLTLCVEMSFVEFDICPWDDTCLINQVL